jgi:glucan-binding YG repeat protein
MDLTKREKRRLKLENTSEEIRHTQSEHELKAGHQQTKQINEHPKSSKSKYYAIAAVIGVIVLVTAAYSVYSLNKPSQYDIFAKCVTQKGAVMYGAMDWCKYTQAQKAMFGNSFKYINYHEFNELEGIKKTPTWVINGAWHENVQSFEKLAALTGCKL